MRATGQTAPVPKIIHACGLLVVASVMFMHWLRFDSMGADFLEHVVDDLALPVIRHAADGGAAEEDL